MPEQSHPSLHDLSVVLAHLADRVANDRGPGLDPIVTASLRRAVDELRLHIPGFETPVDPAAARFFMRAGDVALRDGLYRDALARALRGLSFSPHHPGLFYLAASACFELGAPTDAIELLHHTLWIHPGHPDARLDLESLSAYTEGLSPWLVSGESLDEWEGGTWEEVPDSLRFELSEPDEGLVTELDEASWDEVTRALGEDDDDDDTDDAADEGRRAA